MLWHWLWPLRLPLRFVLCVCIAMVCCRLYSELSSFPRSVRCDNRDKLRILVDSLIRSLRILDSVDSCRTTPSSSLRILLHAQFDSRYTRLVLRRGLDQGKSGHKSKPQPPGNALLLVCIHNQDFPTLRYCHTERNNLLRA